MREKIKLVSSAGTGHFYTTDKTKVLRLIKLKSKNLIPKIKKHVLYKEEKSNKVSGIYLASKSPRRSEILKLLEVEFEVLNYPHEESVPFETESAYDFVERNTKEKSLSAFAYLKKIKNPPCFNCRYNCKFRWQNFREARKQRSCYFYAFGTFWTVSRSYFLCF